MNEKSALLGVVVFGILVVVQLITGKSKFATREDQPFVYWISVALTVAALLFFLFPLLAKA